MKDMMTYKGYLGSVRFSPDDRVFYGKLEFIRSLVTFEGSDVDSLEQAFQESVEEYLNTCKELGKNPEVPFKGSFNIRTGAELHRRASAHAAIHDKSLNQLVSDALTDYLDAHGG